MNSELMPTHFCQTCGARWRQLDDGRWNLRSPGCGPCCDNGPTFNVTPLVMAYDALRGQLHDEIAANHAFRESGGALPDEDMPTFCDRLIRERATLEAEKATREAQEPAGQVIGINTVQWKGHGPILGAKLYYAPPVPHVDPDWLANVIRTVDGNHTMGAGALAEKIAEAINGRAK